MAHLRIHQLFSAPFLLSPNYQLHVFSIVVHFQLRRRVFRNFSLFNKLYVCRRSIFNERLIRTEWDQRDKRSPVLSEIELIHARLKGGMERHPTYVIRKSTERRRPLLRETAVTTDRRWWCWCFDGEEWRQSRHMKKRGSSHCLRTIGKSHIKSDWKPAFTDGSVNSHSRKIHVKGNV